MKSNKNPALLPSGFADLLPPEAGQEAAAIAGLMATFASFGYERVSPPLLEFEESLFAPGPGAALKGETFRLMDPVSHRMMGVRSDITPQIARIATSRLAKTKRPLRLCYANAVLRTRAGQLRTERQFTQVGCEIIGEKNIESDIESAVVALIALDALGVKKVTIDLACPPLIGLLLDQYKLPAEAREKVFKALSRKSPDALGGLPKKLSGVLRRLLQAQGKAEKALADIKALKLAGAAGVQIRQLERIYKGVARAVKELDLDVAITIDPLETRGFKYYSGMGFTLFAKGGDGALGRGGHYDIKFGRAGGESASGFTFYMDTLRKALPREKARKIAGASYNDSWKKIRDQQKSGKIVIRGRKK